MVVLSFLLFYVLVVKMSMACGECSFFNNKQPPPHLSLCPIPNGNTLQKQTVHAPNVVNKKHLPTTMGGCLDWRRKKVLHLAAKRKMKTPIPATDTTASHVADKWRPALTRQELATGHRLPPSTNRLRNAIYLRECPFSQLAEA